MNRPVVLSIVVTSWNTAGLLRTLLLSLRQFPPRSGHEIIVVDNGSEDDTAGMLRREFPDVRLVRNSINRGYAAANNQGFACARGAYVLLLGSDTVVLDDSISTMIGYLDAHEEAGAVTCRLLNADRSPQLSCRRLPTLGDALLTYLSLEHLARRYTIAGFDFSATQEVEQPAASCLMIRRSVIGPEGLFDEAFSILYNDVDLCSRVIGAGWKIVYLGNAEILHLGGRSTCQAGPELRREMYLNIFRYYRGRYGWPAVCFLLPILVVRLCVVTGSIRSLLLVPEALKKFSVPRNRPSCTAAPQRG